MMVVNRIRSSLRAGAIVLAWIGLAATLVGCSAAAPAAAHPATTPSSHPAVAPSPSAGPTLSMAACPDPMAVVNAFYTANDAGKYDEGVAFFADGATLHTYASGLYGDRMEDKMMTTPDQIRAALSSLGLKRISSNPLDPAYQATEFSINGDKLAFYLRPDRTGPNGRPYNPYNVTIEFTGCKFKSMTVIEIISWV